MTKSALYIIRFIKINEFAMALYSFKFPRKIVTSTYKVKELPERLLQRKRVFHLAAEVVVSSPLAV